jgi:hypothetical protein
MIGNRNGRRPIISDWPGLKALGSRLWSRRSELVVSEVKGLISVIFVSFVIYDRKGVGNEQSTVMMVMLLTIVKVSWIWTDTYAASAATGSTAAAGARARSVTAATSHCY